MAAGMVGVVRVLVVVWVLVWCSGAQGRKGTRTGKGYLFTCFVGVLLWFNRVFLYYWHGVPVRGAGGVWWWGVSVGVLVGLVVLVVGMGWQAIPPSSSV